MKVKIFDEESESDLENDINEFIEDKELIDIKYEVSIGICGEDQIYCFSAMIIYTWQYKKNIVKFCLFSSKRKEE